MNIPSGQKDFKDRLLHVGGCYKKLHIKQKRLIVYGVGLVVILLIIVLVSTSFSHKKPRLHYATVVSEASPALVSANVDTPQPDALGTLQKIISQNNKDTLEKIEAMQTQWQNVEDKLQTVASQTDINQLQNTLQQPNPELLDHVDKLQASLQKIVQQTARKQYVSPQLVERSFRLIAVQGFSDGMRVIVSIAGQPLALGVNEACPACQGWVERSMDFTAQTAEFENQQHQFVILTAN